jgi:hypothetical protein
MPDNSIVEDVMAAAEHLESGQTSETVPQSTEQPIVSRETTQPNNPATPERPPVERQRDERGRFERMRDEQEARERRTLTLKGNAAPQQPNAQLQNGQQVQKPPPIAAPKDWSGSAKLKWDRLPREVQQEIAGKWGEVDTVRGELAPIKELIDTNRASLVNAAGSVPEAMRQLIGFHNLYLQNPVALAQHILRSRGIDPTQAFGAQQQQPNGQLDISKLLDQAVQARLQPFQAEAERRDTQQVQQTVESFRSEVDPRTNQPRYPFFEDVRHFMGHLIRSGAARNLQEAYDQATWANPQIRTQLTQAQSEEGRRQAAQGAERARNAQRASVRGAPLESGSSARASGRSSVLDDVRAASAELSGRL